MKKVFAIMAVMVLVVSLASLAFAADAKMGMVKSVDAKAGTIVLTIDGKDATLKADKSVDLSKVKAGDKVMITVDKDTLTSVKAAKAKAAVGC
jgi:hypothetical protein